MRKFDYRVFTFPILGNDLEKREHSLEDMERTLSECGAEGFEIAYARKLGPGALLMVLTREIEG